MSEHSSSSSEEEEVWIRSENLNWEISTFGGLRAIRPEGPFHLPVIVFLARWNSQAAHWETDRATEVRQGDTIWDVECRLGLHRSGLSSGRLSCPVSREDLIDRGEDPAGAGDAPRVFRDPDTRVEDLQSYFWENQVFRIVHL